MRRFSLVATVSATPGRLFRHLGVERGGIDHESFVKTPTDEIHAVMRLDRKPELPALDPVQAHPHRHRGTVLVGGTTNSNSPVKPGCNVARIDVAPQNDSAKPGVVVECSGRPNRFG